MNENYPNFIKQIELTNIILFESHEKLFFVPSDEQLSNVRIDTEHGYKKDDPVIQKNELINNHKYKFTFSVNNEKYFTAEYVIYISFNMKNEEEVKRLLKIDEIRAIFIEKQINKLIWSYIRGIVMDAFNKHSLRPIILPLLG